MKKSFIFTGVILAAIILIELISTITNKTNPPYVYAYDPTYACGAPYFYNVTANIVNDFETSHSTTGGCLMKNPPVGQEDDYQNWGRFAAVPTTYPTPGVSLCTNGECYLAAPGSCGDDTCAPENCLPTLCVLNPFHNASFMRVEWTGQNGNSPQYIDLTQGAFENDYCNGGTYPSPCTVPANNWSSYGYLNFFEFCNYQANLSTPKYILQTVMFYDGNITVTTGGINVDTQGLSGSQTEPWLYHVSASINYLANYYDVTSGRYFSVSNIADVIIPAPQMNYSASGMPTPTVKNAFDQTTLSNSIIIYYDYMTLGAAAELPYYDTPQNVTVKTAYSSGPSPIVGAYIGWSAIGTGAADYASANSNFSSVNSVPVTAYHIYRSLAHSKGTGPWVSVGAAVCSYCPSTTNACPCNVTQFVDTTCPGGDTFCYKVLTCNNGPVPIPAIQWSFEKANTINATYNEPLLNATNVVEICGYVLPPATPTNTPVNTATPCNGGCPSPTITPIPTINNNITPEPTEAFVYPNPFNPRAIAMGYGGSGVFHVGNVADGTTIHIYSMDGALVYDGVYNASNGGFTWNGKNKNGSLVVSGLYYLVLKDPKSNKTAVFRIIVCYKCNPVYSPGP